MLVQRFVNQDVEIGRASEMLKALRESGSTVNPTRTRVAVAFATATGCSELLPSMQSSSHAWRTANKAWLIGIDHGVTEPVALEELAALSNSQVRIPNADYLLAHNLRPAHRFHPKSYLFERLSSAGIENGGLVCGSCNLTFSGLRTGTEHATLTLLSSPSNKDERERFKSITGYESWWDAVWSKAVPLSDAFLKKYKAIRPEKVPNEDDTIPIPTITGNRKGVIDTDTAVGWAFSRCFWIQTFELYKNLGDDKSGNQLDCRRGTRVFFGFPPDTVPKNTVFGKVWISYEHYPKVLKSVRFANNMMDKVNLPIPGTEGPDSYDDCYLHFERIAPKTYRLRIGKSGEAAVWKAKSIQQGMYGTMNGEREFGFYS